MKAYRLAALAAFGVAATGSAWAGEAKWGPHIDFEGKAGTERNLGEADLFLPVAQDDDDLLFASLRTRMDDQSGREGNFGLGLRHMLESGWNLGGYGYFDRRRSEYDNFFNQVTAGAEALSVDWDFRVNGYIPVGRRKYDEDRFNTAEVSGTNVIFRGGEERSLGGFDAEMGWRVPLFAPDAGQQLRVYGGGYRFTADAAGVPDVTGPRGRAEMVFDEVPGLWSGSRLSLGAEVQHDDPRGTQGFGSVRLRIPLQAEAPARLTPMERRMTDPIVRDIDVVAQAGTFGAAEAANQLGNGGTFTVLNSAIPTGQTLRDDVADQGNDSTVILAGTFNIANTVSLATGQTLTGTATVRSASGRIAVLNTGAAIHGTNLASTVQVNAAGTLTGLTISNAYSGGTGGAAVLVAGLAGDVTVANNTITVTQSGNNSAHALLFSNGTSGTASGNTLVATGSGPAETVNALVINGTGGTAVTVAGNSLSASGGTVASNAVNLISNPTINPGSTGNTHGSGTCTGAGGGGTFIGFTSPCPP